MIDELAELTVLGAMDARLAELAAVETASRRVTAGTARAAGVAAGLAVASMGAAVWLAAQFGVPAVVDAAIEPGAAGGDRADPAGADRHRAGGRGGRVDPAPVVGGGPAAVRRAGHPAGDRAGPDAPDAAARRRRSGRGSRCAASAPAGRAPTGTRCPVSISTSNRVGGSWCWANPDRASRRCWPSCSASSRRPPAPITIDGIDVAAMDPDEVRTLFGWCDQRAHLFDSSLAENIRLARPAADDGQIAAALASGRCRGLARRAAGRVAHQGRRARSGGVGWRTSTGRAGQGDARRSAGAAGGRTGRAPGPGDRRCGDRADPAAGSRPLCACWSPIGPRTPRWATSSCTWTGAGSSTGERAGRGLAYRIRCSARRSDAIAADRRVHRGLRPALHVQAGQQPGHAVLDGLLRDAEPVTDLPVGQAVADQHAESAPAGRSASVLAAHRRGSSWRSR